MVNLARIYFPNRLKRKNYAGFFGLIRSKQYNALNCDNISFNNNNPGARGIFWDNLVSKF